MKVLKTLLLGAVAATVTAGAAYAQTTVKVAFIDPLSGPFASTGGQSLAIYQHTAEELVHKKNALLGGNAKFEIVPFDNKISAKESLVQLQVAIDQGIRYIAQGASSGVANALTDAIKKHNKRNPDKRVIFLNHSAVDPALTNKKCNFWHFRFDAHADIKMDAVTDNIKANKDIKKVYIIGQDYSFGKAVAAAAVRQLKEKRPDIEIVGNELHPIGKVKDFTPYARKIAASGADAVITGNWGGDMVGLGKAIIATGYTKPIFTYYGSTSGITAAFGETGQDVVKQVTAGHINPAISDEAAAFVESFKKRFPDADLGQPQIPNVLPMLAKAINEVGNADDVVKVAYALEGMEHEALLGGKVIMRDKDHQAIQTVSVLNHSKDVKFDYDGSGYGMAMESTADLVAANSPTTCKMKRP